MLATAGNAPKDSHFHSGGSLLEGEAKWAMLKKHIEFSRKHSSRARARRGRTDRRLRG